MIVRSVLIAAAASTIAAPAVQAAPRPPVPRAFLGEWHSAARAHPCGEFDNGSIRISARRFTTFESAGEILRVRRIDPATVDLAMRMTHNGGTFGYNGRFHLSADRASLTVSDAPLAEVSAPAADLYTRCQR